MHDPIRTRGNDDVHINDDGDDAEGGGVGVDVGAGVGVGVGAGVGYVLYLPTVCLWLEHNPAFALACHAANVRGVPLVVLAVAVDDAHHRRRRMAARTTARRSHRRW